jgi:hypothetical protein
MPMHIFVLFPVLLPPSLMCLGAEYNSYDTERGCRKLKAVHDRMSPCKVGGTSARQPRSDTQTQTSQ